MFISTLHVQLFMSQVTKQEFTIIIYLNHLVSSGEKERVDFKFRLPGHSFGAVDRDSGRTENTLLGNNEHIETPQDNVQRVPSTQK